MFLFLILRYFSSSKTSSPGEVSNQVVPNIALPAAAETPKPPEQSLLARMLASVTKLMHEQVAAQEEATRNTPQLTALTSNEKSSPLRKQRTPKKHRHLSYAPRSDISSNRKQGRSDDRRTERRECNSRDISPLLPTSSRWVLEGITFFARGYFCF